MSKLIRACIAVAAFAAFAVLPATASATNSATATAPTGTKLATGSAITATSVGSTTMKNAAGEVLVECATAEMTGTLHRNDHTAVEGTINTAHFKGNPEEAGHPKTECKGSSGAVVVTTGTTNEGGTKHWCLRISSATPTDTFVVRGGSCTGPEEQITYTLDVTTFFGTVTCGYEQAQAIQGTYGTHPAAPNPTISNIRFIRSHGGFACPAEGFLFMTFHLKSGNNTVYIDKAT